MKGVYGRVWHIGERGEFREYKGSCRDIQGKNEYWSKKVREVGYDREKRL